MEMESANRSIFWGLVVKPGKRYETEVQEPFRITKACLEVAGAGEKAKVSSLMVECENNEEFIIANLSNKVFNETLDLSFNEGEKICFKVDGPGTVHLTGNLMDQEPEMGEGAFDMMEDSDASEEESEAEEAGDRIQEVLAKAGKRKADGAGADVAKKAKLEEESEDDSDDDEDDEDDEDESGEEETTDADTTANTTAGDDEDDDSDDESDDEEEEPVAPEPVPIKEAPGATPKSVKKKDVAKTPKVEAPKAEVVKAEAAKPITETPKPKADAPETPKSKVKKDKVKTPKAEAPKVETDTPKAKVAEAVAKTPKADVKTPKTEAKTPKTDAKAPKAEAKTPKVDTKTSKADPKTPKTDLKTPKADDKASKKTDATPGKTPKRTLKGGVMVEELAQGTGPEATAGSKVGMFYSGKLQANGKQFDACQDGKPFKFKLGAGEVIKGWDVGVLGMKVGGKRRITVPAKMGYGQEGAQPEIPPNSTLVFEVECKFVK